VVLYLKLGLNLLPAFIRASTGTVIDATATVWKTHT
jgi:hypothetical protein